jgi:hypothetical protein
MIINIIVRRSVDQHIVATARWWLPGGRGGVIAAASWDPSGPVDVRHALRESLRQLLRELDDEARQQVLKPAGQHTAAD